MAASERGAATVAVATAAAVALWFLVLVSGLMFDGVDRAAIEGVLGRAARAASVIDGGTGACLGELADRLPGLGVVAFGCQRMDGRVVSFAEWGDRLLVVGVP